MRAKRCSCTFRRIANLGVRCRTIRARVTYRLNNVPRFEKTAPSVKTTSDRNRLSGSSASPSSSAPRLLRMLFRDYRDSLSRLSDVYRNVTARHAGPGSSPARSGIKSSGNKRLEQKASLTRSNNEEKRNLNKHKR